VNAAIVVNANQNLASITSAGTTSFNGGTSTVGSFGGTGALVVASGVTVSATNALNHGSINSAGIVNVNGGASNVVGTIDGTGVLNVNAGSLSSTHYRHGTMAIASGATATIADSMNPGNTSATGYLNSLSLMPTAPSTS